MELRLICEGPHILMLSHERLATWNENEFRIVSSFVPVVFKLEILIVRCVVCVVCLP